ncbi:MAG: PD-(D/E)XK nuclease family transposase [Bifidobacteriaceae bacterium]|jgi:predicted transposase/invertase (TIGR01784 family)|nr:PD-(D/E)XK nuclease family transposase [Bifidobacteriaceae bacterium]
MDDGGRRLSPTGDLAFKKLLGSEDHKAVIQGFISDFFSVEVGVDEIRIENPYSISPVDVIKDGEELRRLQETFRDVTLAVNVADVIIEMQLHVGRFFTQRSVYYLCDRFVGHYSKTVVEGERGLDYRYAPLRPVYALNIVGESFRDGPNALHMFQLFDSVLKEAMVPDLLRVGYFELGKTGGLSPVQRLWRDFLLSGEAPVGAPGYIVEAAKMMEYVNLGREERDMVDVLEKANATWEAQILYAEDRGFEKGREQGKAAEARLVAGRMLARGMDRTTVSEVTGLSLDELGRINADT